MEEVSSISSPLPIFDSELPSINSAIEWMAAEATKRSLKCERLTDVNTTSIGGDCDEIIAGALGSLSKTVKSDTAEKLYERLGSVVDYWPNQEQQWALGMIFVRMIDTMNYMVAYKKKFRGIERECSVSKSDALAVLKDRGLTRK